MDICNHIFKGHAEGVTCMRCGLRMSAEEYAAYLNPPPKDEPEAPKKPKRARKPKEEPEHE